MKNKIHPVILAGGSGTRFWPLSREAYPKQLLRLVGPDTMLQRTIGLARRIAGSGSELTIVTHEQHADAIRLQVSGLAERGEAGSGRVEILLEPEARNTAAAIGLAAEHIARRDPDALMVVLPADHIIQKRSAFIRAIRAACRVAEAGYLVTLGIKPTRPETGFGYIQTGGKLGSAGSNAKGTARRVKRFVEKPDPPTARRYLRDSRYLWNSGIFVFKASAILDAIGRHLPKLGAGLKRIGRAGNDGAETVRSVYRTLPSISIDHAVMERVDSGRLAVLPIDVGWSDVGSWSALQEILPGDRRGNVVRGNVIEMGCEDSVLYADKRAVAVIGVSGMVVVDTPDATLVCPKDRSQEVRAVVDVLRKRKAEEHMTPKTVERPWGNYTVLESGPGYKIKRIEVRPGRRLSLQLHHRRCEHWVVIRGTARVTRNDEVFDVPTEESTFIPKGARHRLENPGTNLLEIIEVQNGDYLGEDDIVRFQDDFGRNVKR